MKHTISVHVENKPGVLARVSGLFSQRGYNIDSLSVGETEKHDVSIMTIVVEGDDRTLDQIMKQLNKLIDVIKVTNLTEKNYVDRELVLIKVNADKNSRSEIMQIVDIFRAKIVDVSPKAVIVEVTGEESKVEAIISMLNPFGIKELIRAGKVSMQRGGNAEKEK